MLQLKNGNMYFTAKSLRLEGYKNCFSDFSFELFRLFLQNRLMNLRDPILTTLLFNEAITKHDLSSLGELMSNDHTFIDRDGMTVSSKEKMVEAWSGFFKQFPDYRNTFTKIDSDEDLVVLIGYAYWSEDMPYDPVIWTARIVEDHVAEWRIYHDNEENRSLLGVL
jgi:predicted SnoaL-like aldol condensation-catalyzing enzyme